MNIVEKLAYNAYADWLNTDCVDDCQEKAIAILVKAIQEYGSLVRKEDARIACSHCDFAIEAKELP